MIGSNWRIGAAFAGLALAFWLFFYGWFLGASLDPKEQRYPASRSAVGKPLETNTELSGRPNPSPLLNRSPCDNPKGHDERDLCVQWRAANAAEDSAFWAKWGFWIATIGSVLLLWQIILTRKAVKDTSAATKAMERQNEIADEGQRPWISVEDLVINSVEVEGYTAKITYSFRAKNFGRTPAISVCETVRQIRGDDGKRLNIAAIIEDAFRYSMIRSEAIFPDGEILFPVKVKNLDLDPKTTLTWPHPDRDGWGVTFTFLIGVAYLDLSNKRIHYSLKSVTYIDGMKGRAAIPAILKSYLGTVSLDSEVT